VRAQLVGCLDVELVAEPSIRTASGVRHAADTSSSTVSSTSAAVVLGRRTVAADNASAWVRARVGSD